jgi:hypothetical protein
MSIERGNRPDRQRDGEPVIEDARLPRMSDTAEQGLQLMQAQDRIVPGAAAAGTLAPPLHESGRSGPRMASFGGEDLEKEAPMGRGEQRESGQEQESESYIRLRVRLENGSLSIVGARRVDGPLAFDESLQGQLVYEVRSGDRRIGIGSVPDAGEMRSFPPPEPQEGQIGHHVVPLRATEFNVRVRAQDAKPDALERIGIDVYAMKAQPERPRLTAHSLSSQLEQEARLVARLDRIEMNKLDTRVRDELKRATR